MKAVSIIVLLFLIFAVGFSIHLQNASQKHQILALDSYSPKNKNLSNGDQTAVFPESKPKDLFSGGLSEIKNTMKLQIDNLSTRGQLNKLDYVGNIKFKNASEQKTSL